MRNSIFSPYRHGDQVLVYLCQNHQKLTICARMSLLCDYWIDSHWIFLIDFIFIEMGVHEISFLFTLVSTWFHFYLLWCPRYFFWFTRRFTRFHFYSHENLRDFIFIYMISHGISFSFTSKSMGCHFYLHESSRYFILITLGIREKLKRIPAPKSFKTKALDVHIYFWIEELYIISFNNQISVIG